jgi:hypothetical protein
MLVLFGMPLAVVTWFIGWGLYWIGRKNQKHRLIPVNKTESVTLTALLPEPIMNA